jgi:hypothetical protein
MFKLLEAPNQMGDRSIRVSGMGGKMAEKTLSTLSVTSAARKTDASLWLAAS